MDGALTHERMLARHFRSNSAGSHFFFFVFSFFLGLVARQTAAPATFECLHEKKKWETNAQKQLTTHSVRITTAHGRNENVTRANSHRIFRTKSTRGIESLTTTPVSIQTVTNWSEWLKLCLIPISVANFCFFFLHFRLFSWKMEWIYAARLALGLRKRVKYKIRLDANGNAKDRYFNQKIGGRMMW